MKCIGSVEDGKISLISEITDDQYREYKKATMQLMAFVRSQSTFRMVEFNYEEFHLLLTRISAESCRQVFSWDIVETMSLHINRVMLNFLGMVRVYLDHTETRIKRSYGEDHAKLFKAATSREYDGLFAYRFLYKLRNYAQHCGMPVGRWRHNSALSKQGPGVVDTTQFLFVKSALLEDYRDWGTVTKDLESQPKEFDVVPLVDDLMGALRRINATAARLDVKHLEGSVGFLRATFGGLRGRGNIGIIDTSGLTQEGGQIHIEWPPLFILDILEEASGTSDL